jgi:hypothetical protein
MALRCLVLYCLPHPIMLLRLPLLPPFLPPWTPSQDKFSQVNEFLKLMGHTGLIRDLLAARQQQDPQQAAQQAQLPAPERPLQILDCGCGSSHLTFGASDTNAAQLKFITALRIRYLHCSRG